MGAEQSRNAQEKLWTAARGGDNSIVQQIISQPGAESLLAGTCGKEGTTPLFEAARRGHVAIVTMLITSGAPVDQINGNGSTALHEAARKNVQASVKALLDRGANPFVEDKFGRLPMDLARFHKCRGAIQMLRTKALIHSGHLSFREEGSSTWKTGFVELLRSSRGEFEMAIYKEEKKLIPKKVLLFKPDQGCIRKVEKTSERSLFGLSTRRERQYMFTFANPQTIMKYDDKFSRDHAMWQRASNKQISPKIWQFAAPTSGDYESWFGILQTTSAEVYAPLAQAHGLLNSMPSSSVDLYNPPHLQNSANSSRHLSASSSASLGSGVATSSMHRQQSTSSHHSSNLSRHDSSSTVPVVYVDNYHAQFGDVPKTNSSNNVLEPVVVDAVAAPENSQRMRVRSEDVDPSMRCVVCLKNARDAIINPCGHWIACNSCLMSRREAGSNSCPSCSSTMDSIMRVQG